MIFVYLTWLGWRDLNPRNDSVKDCCLYRLTTSHQIISEEELVVGLVYQQFRGGRPALYFNYTNSIGADNRT